MIGKYDVWLVKVSACGGRWWIFISRFKFGDKSIKVNLNNDNFPYSFFIRRFKTEDMFSCD